MWKDRKRNLGLAAAAFFVASTSISAAVAAPELELRGSALDLSTDICPTRVHPDVAVNSDAHEYFVVWADRRIPANYSDIYGQRVAGDGNLIGANIPVLIKPEPQVNPSIAYSFIDGHFLVTWRTQEFGFFNDARGSIIDPAGDPINADFFVNNAGTDGHVAYRTADGSFAHVGRGANILFQGVAPAGGVIAIPGTVSTSGAPACEVAYNPVDDEFIVAWRDQTIQKLFGRRVRPDGTMIGGAIAISPAFTSSSLPAASIVHRASDNRFFVVFGLFQAPGILGQWVGADGALIGGNVVILSETAHGAKPDVAHDVGSDVFVMIWLEEHDLYAQMIDGSGTAIGARVTVARGTAAGYTPRIVHNAATDEFLIVWEDHRNLPQGEEDIFAQRLAIVFPGDLDGDDQVNGTDLALMLGQWSGAAAYTPCPPPKPADLNQDCHVNGLDLALLLSEWG